MTASSPGAPGKGARLAVARAGAYSVGIDLRRISGFLDPDEGEADVALESLLGLPAPDTARKRLRLRHGAYEVLLDVHGSVDMDRGVSGDCQRPALVAAALDRSFLRGVVRDGDRLIYLLDVGRVAKSFTEPRNDGGSPCESD